MDCLEQTSEAEHIIEEEEYVQYDEADCMVDSRELFECSDCNVKFTSIEDHFAKYHPGEEIIVGDIPDEDNASNVENDDDDDDDDDDEDEDENDDILYTCKTCMTSFTEINDLKSHMKSHKVKKKKKSANDAKKEKEPVEEVEVVEAIAVSDHDDHTDANTCLICMTRFNSAKSLKLHIKMHGTVRSKTLAETKREGVYGKSGNVDGSDEDHSNDFLCDKCEKYFPNAIKKIHLQMHSKNPTYYCKTCNKSFLERSDLNMHMNSHVEGKIINSQPPRTSDADRPFECGYCGRGFKRPHEKVKHERIHTGEKPYKCEVCGKSFRVAYCLTLHMRTHTDARPFVCPHCNKRFRAQSVYNHHLMTHTDERPYQCPFCPKAFKTAVHLGGHKNIHTKPFSCTVCNRPFSTLYATRLHMETHKRNESYKHNCHICGAGYARPFALKDHLRESHGDIDVTDEDNTTPVKKKRGHASRQSPKMEVFELKEESEYIFEENDTEDIEIIMEED